MGKLLEQRIIEVFRYHEPNVPPLHEIEDLTGSSASLIMRYVNRNFPDYPNEKRISNRAIEFFKYYKEGMTVNDLAVACGVHYSQISRQLESLRNLGADIKVNYYKDYSKRNNTKPKAKDDEKGEYCKIVDGEYKGMMGRIKSITDTVNVIVWVNCEEVLVKKEMWQVRSLKG